MPQNIYDDPDFFEGYSQFKRSIEGLAGAVEWPLMRSMLPPLEGRRVLDLGCGFGVFARWAREQGAARVLGLDYSERMLARAQELTHDSEITYRRANIEQSDLPVASFDLVHSSLALHYIENYEVVCLSVRRGLVPGGHFVFSVEHPAYTAPRNPGWQTRADGDKFWRLNNYALEGSRVTEWITPGVIKYHRTVSTYVNTLLENDFQLTRLEEWMPKPEQIVEHPDWADEVHRPLFLLIGSQLPTTESG